MKTTHPTSFTTLRVLSLAAAIAIAISLGSAPDAQAQKNWNVNGNGDWNTGGNWNPTGVPTSADAVRIHRPDQTTTPFTITLSDDAETERLGVGDGDFAGTIPVDATINLNGNTLTATTAIRYGPATAGSGNVSITITGDNDTVSAGSLQITGSFADVPTTRIGILTLRGGTALTLTGVSSTGAWVGDWGNGELHIIEGASLTHGLRFTVGATSAQDHANGSMFVQGTGASFINNNLTNIGSWATGHMEVSGGATYTGNLTQMAGGGAATATTLITGSGTTFTTTTLQLAANNQTFPGDGPTTGTGPDRNATFTVADGASASAGLLNVRGDLATIALDGSTLNVTGANSGILGGHAAFFLADSTLQMTLENPFDTPIALNVTNGLQITDAVLDIVLSGTFSASINDVFTVAQYGSRTGTFKDLPDLSTFTVNGTEFLINYGSGTNDFITLTVIPEPSTVGLLLIGGLGAAFLLRRRKSAQA